MSHSVFGWSLPAGCGKLPGEDVNDDPYSRYHCQHCGGFLPMAADRTEYEEHRTTGMDQEGTPYEEIDSATILLWDCRKCHKEHKEYV